MPTADRLVRLRALMRAEGVASLLVTDLPSIRHLAGFTGSAARLLVTPRRAHLVTDGRYRIQAAREAFRCRVAVAAPGKAFEAVADALRRDGVRTLSFEPDAITYADWRALARACGRRVRLAPAPPLAARLRAVKDRAEIALLRRLARMADAVLAACRPRLRPGMTEGEIAALLERASLDAGAEEAAFRPIVAAGAHAAMPHHRPGAGTARRGAPLLIDFGTRMRGYNSDLTRTFHFGKVTARYEGVYRTVLDAQRAALQAIRPGVRAGDVDRAARDVIAAAGHAACFGHSLGHGIGLEVHEEPRLGPGVATKLEAGMVFTVEPGIYLPGWGGVRIEDMAAVTSTGCVVLTGSARELGDSVL
ncbi:MAG: aminopeptidase P family protein [Chlamydiae bacterium]|nr:aminopeptidase P family protein [Chlamydiota bacterium]